MMFLSQRRLLLKQRPSLLFKKARPITQVRAFSQDDPIKSQIDAEIDSYNRDVARMIDQGFGTNDIRKNKVRVRYAPSPTGMMHIGGLRTFLYNYLFTKMHGGDMILRIEDTDKNREVEGSIEDIVAMLKWSGLTWDEGPGSIYEAQNKDLANSIKALGPYGPYYQSQRLPIYHKFAETLIENGDAYPCFCTTERLQEMRIKLGGQKYAKAKYDRFCLHNFTKEQIQEKIANGESYVIRMKIPKGKTVFRDIVHGKIIFDNKDVDD